MLRCICEHGNALLTADLRHLRQVTCCPKRITQIARAALELATSTRAGQKCSASGRIERVSADARNLSSTELRGRLTAFAAWRAANLKGDEKSEAQVYLDRLFQVLGWGGVFEAGASLEYRLGNDNGGTSFADLLWKPRALIEMKKAGADLSRHYRQAFDYWVYAVPDRPRYVILCNFDELWIYDFENQLDAPVDRVKLVDLASKWESVGFLLPQEVEPVFSNDLVAVTRDAAKDVARVFVSLRARGVVAADAQRFVLQCVMAMFSEDVGLLPQHFFTKAVNEATSGAQAFDLIGGLFHEMNSPGITPGGRFAGTPYFNGGLFANILPQELSITEIGLLREACATQWSDVRPEIFGTLFEGSLDAGERHASGAHFTSQADIARIVGPVIIEPWRERIAGATSIRALERILNDMSQYRVLDPACGSGNFLYVAYRELRRLEREVIELIRDRRRSENRAAVQEFQLVSPEQFLGMDINPLAVEVAKVTVLLGKKLADDEMHTAGGTLPLNNLDAIIVAKDALFSEWPEVDAIIGNPPYIGRRKMVEELGAGYCARLDRRFGPKGVADFVTYWFPIAHDRLPEGGRAGFVATKSVKQGDGRKASLDYLVDNGGTIVDAVSHMAWSGEAQVTVSIVNWQKGGTPPLERTLWIDEGKEPLLLPEITSSLSPEIDLRQAHSLRVNRAGVYQGQTLGVVPALKVTSTRAHFYAKVPAQAEVMHPLMGGNELLHNTSITDWVIDIESTDSDLTWAKYPGLMLHLQQTALPERVRRAADEKLRNNEALLDEPTAVVGGHHQAFMRNWWVLWRRRSAMLTALAGLDRYIALTRTSSEERGPIFTFVDGTFHLEDSVVGFPFSDDYSLGILQSKVHEIWFRARCTTLETRLTYTLNSVFKTFVWPQQPTEGAAAAVASAAAAINEYRGKAFHEGRSLGDQYDVLRRPGHSTLRDLHSALDSAVMAAYEFDDEDDVLAQILELNLLISQREGQGVEVTRPGGVGNSAEPSSWAWPAPTL